MQGKKNPGTDYDSVISFLQLVRESREMNIDRWVCFLHPSLSFCMKSSYATWVLTNTGTVTRIQLAHCHENGEPKRFSLWSNCTSWLASFFACISTYVKDRSTRYGNSWTLPFIFINASIVTAFVYLFPFFLDMVVVSCFLIHEIMIPLLYSIIMLIINYSLCSKL